MSKTDEDNVDYQIGANDIDKTTSLGEESELIDFNYESAAIFKRIADDIYKSKEAGIREPLQNGITAVKRAIDSGSLSENDGVIRIEVKNGEKIHLNIVDNGIGISKNVLENVLSVIGRSQNRDKGNLSGKYGMGFLACYKLVGTDGGFIMHTNSRKTDNDPIKGVWKPSCFEMDNGDKLPDKFDKNEYGTRFEFKVDADIENIRSWVEKHSKWATIPIIYEEYDENGEVVIDEEYGQKSLGEDLNLNICVSDKYFKAVCSPEINDGKALLLNSPINTDRSMIVNSIRWNYSIRLKNENGVIISGPNKGLQPVKNSEYKSMSDSRKENYIPKSKLDDNDIPLPEPTGTRDSLESNSKFWSFVEDRIDTKYNEKVQKICSTVDDISSFMNLCESDQLLLNKIIKSNSILKDTNKKTKKKFKSNFNVDVSDEFINIMRTSQKKIQLVNRGSDATKASRKNSKYTDKIEAIKCDKRCSNDGTVYMAVTLNQDKMDAVWEDNSNNIVVRVPSSDYYDELEEHFNWSRLRYVTKRLDELDISDETKNKLKNDKKGTSANTKTKKNSERELKNRHLTVHKNRNGREGFTVGDLEERYKNRNEYLVLFPSNEERNLSEHKYIISEHVSTANCIVKVYDYLKDVDNIYSISDWIDKFNDYEIETCEGDMTVDEVKNAQEDVLLHVVERSVIDAFRDDSVMQEIKTIVKDNNNHCSYHTVIDGMDMNNLIYLPITMEELNKLRVCFGTDADARASGIYSISGNNNRNTIGVKCDKVSKSNIYWYAWARLPRWRNTQEIDCIDNDSQHLNPDWIWLIDNIANSNYEVKSITGMNILPPESYIEYETNYGNLNIKDIISNYDSIVLHITDPKTVDAFRQEPVINKTIDYIMDNATKHRNSANITENEYINEKETVYIPMIESEYSTLINVLEEPDGDGIYTMPDSKKSSYICAVTGELYSSSIRSNHKYAIESDTAAYIYGRLGSDISKIAIPYENESELSELSNGGLELVETINTVDKLN